MTLVSVRLEISTRATASVPPSPRFVFSRSKLHRTQTISATGGSHEGPTHMARDTLLCAPPLNASQNESTPVPIGLSVASQTIRPKQPRKAALTLQPERAQRRVHAQHGLCRAHTRVSFAGERTDQESAHLDRFADVRANGVALQHQPSHDAHVLQTRTTNNSSGSSTAIPPD